VFIQILKNEETTKSIQEKKKQKKYVDSNTDRIEPQLMDREISVRIKNPVVDYYVKFYEGDDLR
jgi:hypothetical protein